MSGKESELEGRLDDLLSRIAMETQEIKELEQQLTDGQILANEALQRELEEVISGLQECLRGLRQKARRSQQQVHSLQLHLEDAQRHCRQLEDMVRTHTQDMCVQQEELSLLQMEAQTLRDRQVESSRQQGELEAELQQLREELTKQVTLGQVVVDEGKQSRESQLQRTVDSLQDHNSALQQEVQTLQGQLNQTRTRLDQFTASLSDPQEELHEYKYSSPVSPEDTLSTSVERLFGTVQQTRTCGQQLQQAHSQLHSARLQSQLDQNQDQDQESDWRLKEELQRLRDRLQRCEGTRLVQENLDVQQGRDTLLQQLRSQSDGHRRSLGRLNRKLRRLSRFICDADQLTAEQLNSTSKQLRALTHTVELLHTQNTDDEPDRDPHQDRPTMDELKTKLADAQRHTRWLRQKLDQIKSRTRTGIGDGDGGRWWFVPPGLSAPSLDSGLGLQYLSSPERGRRQDRPPPGGGYWVYIPPTHTDSEWRDSGGGNDADGSSEEGPPPPPPHPAAGASPGTSQAHLVGPTWLLCGSPAGAAALHCNIPKHRDTQGGRCVCERVHKEAERLQHTLRPHRSVMEVCDDVECVEKTLLKRRAELRQADRKLLEAQSYTHTTQDQATEAQREADLLQRRAQDSAACLLEATQHVRELHEEAEQLRWRRRQEEQALREAAEALRGRNQEFQQVAMKIHNATERLAGVLADCQEAQRRLDSLSCQMERAEQRLLQTREEHQEVREEEQRLHSAVQELVEQQEVLLAERRSAVSGVREEEQRLISLQTELSDHRSELKQVLQELLSEQQALEGVHKKRTQATQQLHRTKDKLDGLMDKLDRRQKEVQQTREGWDRLQDEVDNLQGDMDRKREELAELQGDVDRKREELAELQGDVDRKREELAELQGDVDRKREELAELQGDVDRKREELAELQQEMEWSLGETRQEVQEELTQRTEERNSLQEQCKNLEARRRHASRCLSTVEAELVKQKEEHSNVQCLKQEVVRDMATAQQQLNENSGLLSLLSERLEDRKKQLQTLDQELGVSRQQQQDRAEQHTQTVCVGLEDVKAAVSQLEDRGRRLTDQQLQLNQLSEELCDRETRLLHKGEGLRVKGEELSVTADRLQKKEEELHEDQEVSGGVSSEDNESFYLFTSGLRSACSTQNERWGVELQEEELRQQEDRLKACLRCRLWNQQDALKVRRLEAEDSLQGLRRRLDRLDSLLAHSS